MLQLCKLLLLIFMVSCAKEQVMEKKSSPKTYVQHPNYDKAALLNVEMGRSYLDSGQVARAKKKLLHALKLSPKLPEAHTAFGYFWESVGDLEESEKSYKRAISYGDGRGSFYNNYGTFLCRNSRYDEAEQAFKKAISDRAYLKTAEVYENAGLCALQAADLTTAEKYLFSAVRYDRRRSKSLLHLTEINYDKSKYLQAEQYLQQYHSQEKPSARSLLLSIKLADKLGDKDRMASDALVLKNLFAKSNEYKLYLSLYGN